MVTDLTYSPPYMNTLLKIVHASFLLDAAGKKKIWKVGGKGMQGIRYAAARVCWLEPCSTRFICRLAYIRRYYIAREADLHYV
jgi:hypothetical protein